MGNVLRVVSGAGLRRLGLDDLVHAVVLCCSTDESNESLERLAPATDQICLYDWFLRLLNL